MDTRDDASIRVAFHENDHVGTRDYQAFAAQWLAYALPCRRFAVTLAGASARLGADADRYSFTVVDLHHLLLAGFDRRTEFLKFRSMSNQCFTVDHDVLGSIRPPMPSGAELISRDRPLLATVAGLSDHSQHFLHPQKRHTDPTSLVDDLELDRSSRDAARLLAKHGPTSISMPRMLSEVPTLVGRGMMQPTKGETLNRL
jgi:hypothetical protein